MRTPTTPQTSPHQLRDASLGTGDIVFFVVAAAAPLGATLGVAPILFSIAGGATPGLFVVATVVLTLFAIGLAAISRHVSSAGGFAEMAARGLGPTAGHATAGVALLAYVCLLSGVYAQFGAYAAEFFQTLLGTTIDWRLITLLALGCVGCLGYRDIDLSAKVLGGLLVLEVISLLVFDIAVLLHTPLSAMQGAFAWPRDISVSTLSIALMFPFACFVGFESATIYGEEARDPHRTVPLALYTSIGLIAGLCILTMVCLSLAYGHDGQASARGDMTGFVFEANRRHAGEAATVVMKVLGLTSMIAVLLSFHNTLSRYGFSLGRSGFLPVSLARVHAQYRSPHRASLALTAVSSAIAATLMIVGADPITDILMLNAAVGTLGILTMQTLGAAAIVCFLLGLRRPNRRDVVAASLSAACFAAVTGIAFVHFDELSGSDRSFVRYLPLLIASAAAAGILNGRRLSKPITPLPLSPLVKR